MPCLKALFDIDGGMLEVEALHRVGGNRGGGAVVGGDGGVSGWWWRRDVAIDVDQPRARARRLCQFVLDEVKDSRTFKKWM